MASPIFTSRSVGNLPAIGKREDGEGLESSCDKVAFEEYGRENNSSTVDDLLRDTISELQKALYESKRLLSERDSEINALRNQVEEMRKSNTTCTSVNIEDEFKKSQLKVIDLEKIVQKLQKDVSIQRSQRDDILKQTKENEATVNGGHTCYCGSICVAMKEVVDLKRKLHQTEQKYLHLKRNMRTMERSRVRVGVAQRDSPCTVS